MNTTLLTRRAFLQRNSTGLGALALASLLKPAAFAAIPGDGPAVPGLLKRLHHTPRAKRVIYLFMSGAPSHLDLYDPKPKLVEMTGKDLPESIRQGQRITGMTSGQKNLFCVGSPFKFAKHGQCGTEFSELLPNIASLADEATVIRSMFTEAINHDPAVTFFGTGHQQPGRPTMGAWASYGLGSENQNLPGFVVLNGGLTPPGGLENFGSGFLPATFQGSVFRASAKPLANIQPLETSAELQKNKLAFMRKLDAGVLDRIGHIDQLESAIGNYELAFRMQAAVPELMDLKGESDATKKLYGLDAAYEPTKTFGQQCLIARRLVERGVRFIELTCPGTGGDRWDQHSDLKKGHTNNARAVDQPIAGLLKDLKARGLLDSTLVIWGGEFGRTPFAQGSDGRDHNPFGFSIWLAGGGVKGGTIYGATDEYGYKAIENKVLIHDFHATLLHLLGLDHLKLTFRFSGRDMRLTDVHGEVIREILA